jgi:hypothetical protein
MNDLAKSATAFVNNSKGQWANLVDVALALSPKQLDKGAERLAKLAGVGKKTVKQKMLAVRFKADQGWSADTIKVFGQGETLASYVRETVKARTEPLVAFPHRLTRPVRDALEETCRRVSKRLGLKTYDDVFELVVAVFAHDEDIDHLGGAITHDQIRKGDVKEKTSAARR